MYPSDPFSRFPLILCINLDSRPDRWAQCQQEFAKVGIQDRVERLQASTGVHPEHGCALSHVRAMRRMLADGLDRVLVLEDDVEFLPNVLTVLAAALLDLGDRRCDAFFVGCLGGRFDTVASDLLRVRGTCGTHAVMYSPKALEVVEGWYGNLDNWDRPGPIDVVLSDQLVSLGHCYAPNPIAAIQRASPSSMDLTRGHHFGHEMRYYMLKEWEQAVNNCPGVRPLVLA